MIHDIPQVQTKITQEQIDHQRMELAAMQLTDDEFRRQKALLDEKEKTLVYDPEVMVVIELIDEQTRRSLTRPLVWSRNYGEEPVKFGFWNQPRPNGNPVIKRLFGVSYPLDAWQEIVPADMGLPKVQNMPHAWRLVYDPRVRGHAAQIGVVRGVALGTAAGKEPVGAPPEEPLGGSLEGPVEESIIDTDFGTDSPEESEDDFGDSLLNDEDPVYDEFLALEQEVISQGGPTKGQVKKNVPKDKLARYEELRDVYQPE